jgi:GNAT superfamily N-acetyltransferase
MTPDDEAALLRFFLRTGEEDRFYLKEDVTSPSVIRAWCEGLDYDRTLPLLAFAGEEVVADATLHRGRAGARRHNAEARLVVDPEYRNRGLGSLMLKEILEIAYDAELDRVVMELVAGEQQDAIAAAQRLGFIEVARLPGHAQDRALHPRDLVILEAPLGKWYEWWQF